MPIELSKEEIATLIRALDHVRNRARNAGGVIADVDYLCRRECLVRWELIRERLNRRLPKKERIL